MKNVAFTIDGRSGILLFVDGTHSQIPQDHPNFSKIRAKLEARDFVGLEDLMDARSAVRNWLRQSTRFTLTNDRLALDGVSFTDKVTDKVLSMIEAGNDASALFNFLLKVRQNPSHAAQNELLLFCVANKFMIHEDGDILAYKSVRDNFTDIHSGKFLNTVGSVNTMPRNTVDDNRNQTCSTGLHFASHEYASTWTTYGHLMLIKVNPRDVVSIPSDYDNQKGRTCRYEVVAELMESKPLPHKEVYSDSDYLDEDEDLFDEDEDGCDCGSSNAHRLGYINYCSHCGQERA